MKLDSQIFTDVVVTRKILLFYIVYWYPTPFIDVNLKAMNNIGKFMMFKLVSDHTLGSSIIALVIIEKHFLG